MKLKPVASGLSPRVQADLDSWDLLEFDDETFSRRDVMLEPPWTGAETSQYSVHPPPLQKAINS